MQTRTPELWDDAIRRHGHRVYISVLALGLSPDRAKEIVQSTWTRLMEQHARGALTELDFPGLAIRQARFLALDELQRKKTEMRVLAAVPEAAPEPGIDRIVADRQQIDRMLDALATCSPMAKRVFRIVYATPGGTCARAAQEVGLSLQRVRQILCETRTHIRRALEATP